MITYQVTSNIISLNSKSRLYTFNSDLAGRVTSFFLLIAAGFSEFEMCVLMGRFGENWFKLGYLLCE